jgi:hypothetical protein
VFRSYQDYFYSRLGFAYNPRYHEDIVARKLDDDTLNLMEKIREQAGERDVTIDIRPFVAHPLYANRAFAFQVPWRECVRDIRKHPRARTKNQRNYWTNQKALREAFLEMLEAILQDRMDAEAFGERLAALNRVLLTGSDGKTYYISSSMARDFELPQNPNRLTPAQVEDIEYLAGRFINQSRVATRQVNDLFERVREFMALSANATADRVIDAAGNFFLASFNTKPPGASTYVFEKGNNSLFMNLTNALLRLHGMKGVSHGELDDFQDYFSGRLDVSGFRKAFLAAVVEANPKIISQRVSYQVLRASKNVDFAKSA